MAAPFRLSVLDQTPIAEGSTGSQALQRSVDLGVLADSLGYARTWFAEHHATPMLAGAAPEILIAATAARTRRLRLGSGGIMLPHYSPVKVAETFGVLAGLHPGRIDLGLGRAPGSDGRTALALQRDRRQLNPDDFPEQLAELLALIEDRMPAGHPFAAIGTTLPGRPEAPEPWLLGSSPQSGLWAAELGLPYMFADFISPHGAGIAARYRSTFEPSMHAAEPYGAVAVSAICAETDEEAGFLSASARMAFLLFRQGRLIPVPRPEAALAWLEEAAGGADAAPPGRRMIAGSPETVRAGLEAVAQEYGAREVMVVTIVHDHAARRRSYELIAQAFGLEAGMEAGPPALAA